MKILIVDNYTLFKPAHFAAHGVDQLRFSAIDLFCFWQESAGSLKKTYQRLLDPVLEFNIQRDVIIQVLIALVCAPGSTHRHAADVGTRHRERVTHTKQWIELHIHKPPCAKHRILPLSSCPVNRTLMLFVDVSILVLWDLSLNRQCTMNCWMQFDPSLQAAFTFLGKSWAMRFIGEILKNVLMLCFWLHCPSGNAKCLPAYYRQNQTRRSSARWRYRKTR